MNETRVVREDLDEVLKRIKREGTERIVSIETDGPVYVVKTALVEEPPLEIR